MTTDSEEITDGDVQPLDMAAVERLAADAREAELDLTRVKTFVSAEQQAEIDAAAAARDAAAGETP